MGQNDFMKNDVTLGWIAIVNLNCNVNVYEPFMSKLRKSHTLDLKTIRWQNI